MAIEQSPRKSSVAAWLLGGGIVVAGFAAVIFPRPWESAADQQQPAQQQVSQQQGEPIVQSETTAKSVTAVSIPVEGMSCMSCVASIKRATTAIEGVKDVKVDLAGRSARIEYAPVKTTPEQIAAAIAGLGYKVGTPVAESK